MKLLMYVCAILMMSLPLQAHCGGCGPSSYSSHSSSSFEQSECSNCEEKSSKLNLSRKEQLACNKIMRAYKEELKELNEKYSTKFSSILTDNELALYLEQEELNL